MFIILTGLHLTMSNYANGEMRLESNLWQEQVVYAVTTSAKRAFLKTL